MDAKRYSPDVTLAAVGTMREVPCAAATLPGR
jgi:hypothetical protein